MSTIRESLNLCSNQFVDRLVGPAIPDIPPHILRHGKAVVFMKRCCQGKLKKSNCSGIFMKRDMLFGTWSLPVAVHFSHGDVFWSKNVRSSRRFDILVVITNEGFVREFEETGEFKFMGINHIRAGPVVKNDPEIIKHFEEDVKQRYGFSDTAFSYVMENGQIHPCHIDEPILNFRASSNRKFYQTEQCSLMEILSQQRHPSCDKIREVQGHLTTMFDIETWFPYFQTGQDEKQDKQRVVTEEEEKVDNFPIQPLLVKQVSFDFDAIH